MAESEVNFHARALFTRTGAAAVMGNIAVETGGSFDVNQRQHQGGPGRGLIQMEHGMWSAYQNWLAGRPDSVQNQLRFVAEEIRYGRYIGAGNARQIRDAFASDDVDNATRVFCERFERANSQKMHLARRVAAARRYAPAALSSPASRLP